jgi:hypothetical protein
MRTDIAATNILITNIIRSNIITTNIARTNLSQPPKQPCLNQKKIKSIAIIYFYKMPLFH